MTGTERLIFSLACGIVIGAGIMSLLFQSAGCNA